MIELNLLPPQEKRLISSHLALRQIFNWGTLTLFLILIFLLLLSSIWLFLLVQVNSVETLFKKAESSPQGKIFMEFKKEIDSINQRLKYLDDLQAQTKNYSFVLEKLTELVPAGIKFRSVSINQKKVTLEGYAQTREDLLAFKKSLESSPQFEKIESPLSNFLKQTDINFSFTFLIK